MKKYEFKVSTGITSILMIFVVLCLTAFGVLSYTSANADMNLSEKNANYISVYYMAEGMANEKISRIDEILLSGRENSASDEDYRNEIKSEMEAKTSVGVYSEKDNTVTVTENVGDRKVIKKVIRINPLSDEDRYTIVSSVLTDK